MEKGSTALTHLLPYPGIIYDGSLAPTLSGYRLMKPKCTLADFSLWAGGGRLIGAIVFVYPAGTVYTGLINLPLQTHAEANRRSETYTYRPVSLESAVKSPDTHPHTH